MPRTSCYTGEVIEGTVVIETTREVSSRGLYVDFTGTEETVITRSAGKTTVTHREAPLHDGGLRSIRDGRLPGAPRDHGLLGAGEVDVQPAARDLPRRLDDDRALNHFAREVRGPRQLDGDFPGRRLTSDRHASPDEEPRAAVGTGRDAETVHVGRRAAAVRTAQGHGALLARGDHRLLDRRRGRDRPPTRGRRQGDDDEDDDEQERDTEERREPEWEERRGTGEGECDHRNGQDHDHDGEDEADDQGVGRRTAGSRSAIPPRRRGRRLGHVSELGAS